MFGWTIVREKLIRQMADDFNRLNRENASLRAQLNPATPLERQKREQSIRDHLKEIRGGEEIKRHEAKASVSKEVIREMREAIKVAIVSIRDLAGRRPNEVTAEHLAELRGQAENLVRFTSLPHR
jgi:hypothetical protein